jgi:hypothetical protein
MDSIQPETQDAPRYVFRLRGTSTAEQLAQEIAETLWDASQAGLREALLDITAVYGFESPDAQFRAWAVRLWTRAAGLDLRIAMVARREHICPHKTGLLVAAEEGLQANIFDTEADAIAWLDSFRAQP